MQDYNSTQLGTAVPENKTTPNPGQIGAAKENNSTQDFNHGAEFLQVLTRIAAALERIEVLAKGGGQ